jgi:hypothetical protein
MYGWNEKPAKADVAHLIGGDNPATVYEVGSYEVTVPGEECGITYRHKYRHTSDPAATLPNMMISDGEIRIPITDLVGEVLKRLEPAELAKALWTNEEVRAEFIEALSYRYMFEGVEDKDRREFLRKVKEQVHSVAMDRLAEVMATQEYAAREKAHYYNRVNHFQYWWGAVQETLRKWPEALEAVRFGHGAAFKPLTEDDPDFRIGGKHWNEARDFWRDEVLKQFPKP